MLLICPCLSLFSTSQVTVPRCDPPKPPRNHIPMFPATALESFSIKHQGIRAYKMRLTEKFYPSTSALHPK